MFLGVLGGVFWWCFWLFLCVFVEVARVFEGSFKEVSRTFQESFKSVSRIFQKCNIFELELADCIFQLE